MQPCPSCQKTVLPLNGSCPLCGWRFKAVTIPGGVTIPVGGLSFSPNPALIHVGGPPKLQVRVDLALIVDRTGSSDAFKEGIKASSRMLVESVRAKARDLFCWVGTHGDLDEGQPFVLHTDRAPGDQAIADVQVIDYNGGGDPPEHHLDGIQSMLDTVPWNNNPLDGRGAVVAFLTADTKPAKSGITAAQLGKRFKDQEVLLYLICEPTPTLVELVDAAGGHIYPITNTPSIAEMQAISAEIAKSITDPAMRRGSGTIPA